MNYKNAKNILPDSLVAEIQRYADGELLYIPSKSIQKSEWGLRNGTKQKYRERNDAIQNLYRNQMSIQEIAEQYFLSVDSIKKIVRK